MLNARDLRLQSDYQHLKALADGSGGTLVIETATGRPPDQYVLLFKCRSIERLADGKPVYRTLHRMKIRLPAKYPAPSAPPQAQMLTPIFHPHVYPNGEICMGSWETSEYLDMFVLRMGASLQFDRRYLNVRDPANEQATYWANRNLILLPTDTCTFQAGDAPLPPPVETVPMQPLKEEAAMSEEPDQTMDWEDI